MSTTSAPTDLFVPTARMSHPVFVLDGAYDSLMGVNKAITRAKVPERTRELMSLRAAQINGCGVCAAQHPVLAKKLGETDERLNTVAVWRDAPFFTEAERAALALTEAVTRMADTGDAVPEDLWQECAAHYSEQQLAGLVLSIAMDNFWNRVNVTTAQVAGQGW